MSDPKQNKDNAEESAPEKGAQAIHEIVKQISVLQDRDHRNQGGLASQDQRLSESKRQIDIFKAHQQELKLTLDNERKRHHEEMEKVSEDYAMMMSDRDHHKAQSEMREIEVKRMRKQETSPGNKNKGAAAITDPNPGNKENNVLTDIVEQTPPPAPHLNPRQSRATPVLVVRRKKRPVPKRVEEPQTTSDQQVDPRILAPETLNQESL